MPITLKQGLMKYKNGQNEYIGINTVGETASVQQISNVNQAGATQVSAINAKGQEVLASLPSDYTALNDEVTELKDAFDAVVESTDVWSDPVSQSAFTRLENKNFTSANGTQDKTGWSILYWRVDESGFYDIVYDLSNANNLVKIYTSDTFTSANFVKNATGISTKQKQVEVEAGQYIVAQAWSMTYELSVTRKTGEEYSVPEIDEKIAAEEDNLFPTGWGHFPVENFSRNEWTGYNSTSDRNYRVKYNNVVQFNRDTYLKANLGFYLETYTTPNVYSGVNTSFVCLANTPYKINIRRKTETSSETADIAEFADALEYSTPLSGMERNKLTFSDISMFERVGIGGDSYASGGGYISGIRSLTWGKNLERQAGITVDIYAQSGQAIHTSNGWNYNTTNGLPALLAGEECGLYWLAHGINSGASSCGTPEDMDANPKPYTFYGQYAYAIEAIQSKFPRARIVISTVEGTSMALYQTVNSAVNTAIKNIAEHFSIPLIDLADEDFYWSKFYEDNGLSNHPTAMLCAGMAMANRRLLSKAILNNPSYFIDFGNKYKTAISCPMVDGGSIKATPSIAANGATVTLSNTPLPGYHFVRYESADVTIVDGSFVVPGTSGGVGHGTYTITGVFEADA